MVKVAIYARLSDDRNDDKLGIDNQLGDCRKLANERGWTVVGEYVDPSLSASKKNAERPAYNRLVKDYSNGKFEALMSWDLDRLTRQPRQLEDWIDAAEDRNLLILTANGEADLSNDNGVMFARMKVVIAKAEADRSSRRLRRNAKARREAGLWHGGSVPYGYRQRGEKQGLEPEPKEVAIINRAAKRLLAGDTMYSIVADMNKEGLTTRHGNAWRQSNLRPILLNRSLLGETAIRDQDGARAEGVQGWSPVIEKLTFERVTKILTDPSRKSTQSPGVRGGKYSMGGGLTVCATCGHRLITHSKRARTTLACLKRVYPSVFNPKTGEVIVEGACGKATVDHDLLESYVFEQVISSLKENPRWGQRLNESSPNTDEKIAALKSEKEKIDVQRERAYSAYKLGGLNDHEYSAEVQQIRAELDLVQKQINGLLDSTVMEDAFADGLDWKSWTPLRRRNFLKVAVHHIAVSPWPKGQPFSLPRRNGESEEAVKSRRRKYAIEMMEKRVEIVTHAQAHA